MSPPHMKSETTACNGGHPFSWRKKWSRVKSYGKSYFSLLLFWHPRGSIMYEIGCVVSIQWMNEKSQNLVSKRHECKTQSSHILIVELRQVISPSEIVSLFKNSFLSQNKTILQICHNSEIKQRQLQCLVQSNHFKSSFKYLPISLVTLRFFHFKSTVLA